MKRLVWVSYLLPLFIVTQMFANSCANSCSCAHTSKSFFAVRPPFQESSPELVSNYRYDRYHARKNGVDGAIQLVGFGGQSTNSTALGKYFMPFCNNQIKVTLTDEEFPRDTVYAQHFNIFTQTGTFESVLTFSPKQSYGGLGFSYRQDFLANNNRTGFFWVSISLPVEHVRNDMELCEKVTDTGGGANPDDDVHVVANMTQAFAQEEWQFGKIMCAQSLTGVADIQVKLGYEWLHPTCHVEGYIGGTIPTGNKPTAKYMFEPVVGNGRHGGIIVGSACGFQLWHNNGTSLHIEWAINNQYLFSNTQNRSFDLKGKPWSRYMEVYANQEEAQAAHDQTNPQLRANQSSAGINIFTKPMHVTPGFSYNVNAALVVNSAHGFSGEIGYNAYSRDQECVSLDCGWQEGPALKALLGDGATQPLRNITPNIDIDQELTPVPLADYADSIIKLEDLDLDSAAHPAYLSHTFYATTGYRWDKRACPTFASLGASYEFSTVSNAVLDRWMVWGKVGVSF